MQENNKVLLGMSGGTDSSVAALLLQDAGYEVTGVTFRFYEKGNNTEYLDDARELCERLHILSKVWSGVQKVHMVILMIVRIIFG